MIWTLPPNRSALLFPPNALREATAANISEHSSLMPGVLLHVSTANLPIAEIDWLI